MTVTKNWKWDIASIKVCTGLVGDGKPTDIPAGSRFLETDTGVKYIYDGSSWVTVTETGTVQSTAASLNATVTPVSWAFSPECSTGTTVIKAEAGQLHGVLIETDKTTDVSVQFFNHASSSTGSPMTPIICVAGGDNYGGFIGVDNAFSLGYVITVSGANGIATVQYR